MSTETPQKPLTEFGIAKSLNKSLNQYTLEADRIRALPAYARLTGLYQFAINYDDPTVQNRQTHTEYVAETARRIAEALGLNESSQQLSANIGLIHDIGHPPFSHWGEVAINKRLQPYGKEWSHDTAGLQVVTNWSISREQPFGAQISAETLEGLTKRFWKYDPNAPLGRDNHSLTELPESVTKRSNDGIFQMDGFNHLEGQIAAQSDRLSFNATDIQDGLLIGRFTPEMLQEHFPLAYTLYMTLLDETAARYLAQPGNASFTPNEVRNAIIKDPKLHAGVFAQFAERFRALEIDDIVQQTRTNMDEHAPYNAHAVRKLDRIMVTFSPELEKQIRGFSKFCKDEIFPKATAPFEALVDNAIGHIMDGTVSMSKPYQTRFNEAEAPQEKLLIIAEYMTREMTDRDVIALVKEHSPKVYAESFPGYERVTHAPLSETELHAGIKKALSNRKTDVVGMPTILASQLDFSDDKSIPLVSTTRKYILPIPDEGVTVQIPAGSQRRNGLSTRDGEPVFDSHGKPFSGKGIIWYNPEDDQWVAARTGCQGADREVFIINDVTEKERVLLDEKRATWADPDKPTLAEIKEMLKFASTVSMRAGGGTIKHVGEGSLLKTIYPSQVSYITRSMSSEDGSKTSPYGFKTRDREMVCRAIYIDHPFELFHKYGHSERVYNGGLVIDRGEGDYGVVQQFRALSSYEHSDGRKLKLSDIPVQRIPLRSDYQTTNDASGTITTTINIVGSGVAGIAGATHIIREFKQAARPGHVLKFNIIDSATSPAGPTYNRPDANIVGMANPIGILGIDGVGSCVDYFNQDPKKWMELIPELETGYDPVTQKFNPNTIITHNHYGMYVRDHFRALIHSVEADGLPIDVNYINDRVIDSIQTPTSSTLTLRSGAELTADATILCTGNALPRPVMSMENPPRKLDGMNGYNRLDDQAWSINNINESDNTVILGTANGALFGALWAIGNGYKGKVTLVSNSGNVPEIAGESKPYTRSIFTLDALKAKQAAGETITANLMKELFDAEVKAAKANGSTWRDVVDSMAPDTNSIWRMMSEAEQKNFTQQFGSLWNNARYRIPNEHWAAVQKLQAEGRLEIVGGLKGIKPLEAGGFEVHFTNADGSDRMIQTDKIVNNTGPSKRISEMPSSIQNLVKSGDARAHHNGGLDVDDAFRIVGKNGDVTPNLYALGPITAGAHLESVTVPAIRANAQAVAKTVVTDLVHKKEKDYSESLAPLKNQHAAPTQTEIEHYAREFIETGKTTDPRNPNRADIVPTTELYTTGVDANGKRIYTAERLAVHQQIIDEALAWNPVTKSSETKTPSEKPSFICVSGGMSVGMTYMQRLMINEGIVNPENTVIITPLSFMPMHEFAVRNHYQHPEKSPLLVDEYYDVVQKIVDAATARGLNVMLVDQADYKAPIVAMAKGAKEQGYETAMMGMTMTPEAYHRASELWLHKFNRLPDHRRGFGDLQEHATHWDDYTKAFDTTSLFETYFHVEDIDKAADDPTRKEYTVKRLMSTRLNENGVETDLFQPRRMEEFKDRARYINADATTPEEARSNYPYPETPQLAAHGQTSAHQTHAERHARTGSIADTLERFTDGDFENKFVALVRSTSEQRSGAAAQRGQRQ